jgi:hypothetical protein
VRQTVRIPRWFVVVEGVLVGVKPSGLVALDWGPHHSEDHAVIFDCQERVPYVYGASAVKKMTSLFWGDFGSIYPSWKVLAEFEPKPGVCVIFEVCTAVQVAHVGGLRDCVLFM